MYAAQPVSATLIAPQCGGEVHLATFAYKMMAAMLTV
jgi:hypothetical protein